MRDLITLTLVAFLAGCAIAHEAKTSEKQPIRIEILCEKSQICEHSGNDIHLTIRLINTSTNAIELPISFLRKSGPIIELVDNKTGRTSSLRKILADRSLLNELKIIQPGQHENIDWIISTDEIEQFQQHEIDITLRASISTSIVANHNKENVKADGMIKISGRPINNTWSNQR